MVRRRGPRLPVLAVVASGTLYFALVFGAGFVLGPIRVLWAEPRFGTRAAELIEMPIMLVVMLAAARWIAGRFGASFTVGQRLGMGLWALGLLVGAELALVLPLRGMSIGDYFASRDPVSGTVYYLMLALLALLPALVRRH